jgi:hypothetical protein
MQEPICHSPDGELEIVLVASLVLDVFLYDSPIPTSTYRGSIVPIRPELSSPQVFLERWVFKKHTLCSDALEEPHDLADAVFGMEAHQHMHMVLVITELFDGQVVPLFHALDEILFFYRNT